MNREGKSKRSATEVTGALLPWLSCAVLGLAAGLINGLLGAAGGILLVSLLPHVPAPSFVTGGDGHLPRYRFGDLLSDKDVFAAALAVMMPASLVSLARYLQGGVYLSAATVADVALPASLGGLLGAYLLGRISPRTLRGIFSVLVFLSGLQMIL